MIVCNVNVILQQRREKDEFKIAELKMEIKRLDLELTVEIKRRTEMNKSTQAVRRCRSVLCMHTVCICIGMQSHSCHDMCPLVSSC
jgi:hypothetical protein